MYALGKIKGKKLLAGLPLTEGQLTVPINASQFSILCVMGYVKQIYIWPGGQKHKTKGCLN